MKKILSILLSLSVIASSAVAVSAAEYVNTGSYGDDPFFTFEAIEIDPEVYEYAMEEEVPEGATPYQISVDVINLPDLTYAKSGKGTRIGTLNLTMYCDISKIEAIQTMNANEMAEEWLGDYEDETYKYGWMGITSDNAALNGINNSISVSKLVSSASDGFPTKKDHQDLDVDGVLEDAIVLWVLVTEPVEITKLDGTIQINYDGLENYDSYQSNGVASGYVIGGSEGGEEGGDNDDTAIEMVAGNQNIVGGRHDGKAAISAPEAVAVEGIAKITVENSADADRVEEWVAPTTLGNGKTKVLAVVTYDKAAMAGTTFTVKYLNAALEAIKTFTYTVGQ